MLINLLGFGVTIAVLTVVGVHLRRLRGEVARMLADQHATELRELSGALAAQADRLNGALADATERLRGASEHAAERLREAVMRELAETRDRMGALQLAQTESLARTRELSLEKIHVVLAEQGRAGQEALQGALAHGSRELARAMEQLAKTTDARLDQISGKVSERLDEGFKKTNETFAQVMSRLATIDEAQKKIDGLTTNVVSLQELLGDKRSRGAFGEVQLEGLVRNALPPNSYAMQHTFSTGSRVDCALFLPHPTGTVPVDSKFPLENFQRMTTRGASDTERTLAARQFKADVKRHIDDIADKYILPGETSEGAVMFVPAESVFAEIHSYHPDLVEHAMKRRVWVVSPTTMMAILNTARAVLKDVETRKQVHIIKDNLSRLGQEFGRFDERMKKLADHIRMAHKDAEEVWTTSKKISTRFQQIERVELAEHEGEYDAASVPAGSGWVPLPAVNE
jgi:DNA recombination protein RmuC